MYRACTPGPPTGSGADRGRAAQDTAHARHNGRMARGLWCGAGDCGRTPAEVDEFVARAAGAGFDLLLVELKGGHGLLRYPSRAFPQAVEPGYAEFDLPAHLLESCRRRGVELHAWMIDFFEGEDGPAYRQHPEWAARDPHGRPTNEERLRGERFTGLWMCPARRPGYTDQWLVPLLAEFAGRYGFDAVHHDYVRYPGDLAPDQYCFCDGCLEELPRWAGYASEARPDEAFDHAHYDREYLEAHWEQSPRVLPAYWERLRRHEKARFLLEGGFFRYGRQDLDYFFYRYRTEAVVRFVREAAEAVRAARPGTGLSAAVFKNPVHSGRFIGQDWREFAPWVDTVIPMDYRDHFPGTFEDYLALLGEAVRRQRGWAGGFRRYLAGFALWPLVRDGEDEGSRAERMRETIALLEQESPEGWAMFCAGDLGRYGLWEALPG